MFYNSGTSPIHKATLRVSDTHGLVACGIILPGKECSTTFPQREYQGSPVIISWEQAGHSWTTGEFNVLLPTQPPISGPSMAIVTLGDHGVIDVRLVPQASALSPVNELQPQLQ